MRMTAKPWPAHFELPLYAMSQGIRDMLYKGEMLVHERHRSEILGALYMEATQYML